MRQESLPQFDDFEDSARVLREQAESLGTTSVEALEKRHSDEFEQLVRAALEKELKYERDPNLKDIAGKRADQIIAAYQSGLVLNPHQVDQSQASDLSSKPEPSNNKSQADPHVNETEPPRLDLPKTSGPIYPTSSTSFSLADIIMGAIIALLVIIIIILLV